jgi:hypothetical protein
MNNSERRTKNRKRCLNCKYYGCNVCPLMANGDVFQIDNCILENEQVKHLKEGTAEWFMFKYNPHLFLGYLNFQRKDKLPKVGSKVVTLRSGFGGYAGVTRYVKKITEKYIELVDHDEEGIYISNIDKWYNDFFEI